MQKTATQYISLEPPRELTDEEKARVITLRLQQGEPWTATLVGVNDKDVEDIQVEWFAVLPEFDSHKEEPDTLVITLSIRLTPEGNEKFKNTHKQFLEAAASQALG